MSRRAHLLLLLFGIGAFALLVVQIGPATLLADIRTAGWAAVPAVLLFALVYLTSSEAWRLTIPQRPPPLSSIRAFAITAWAFALNYVTPMVSVGGEPFKIAASAQWIGTRPATASVVSERLLQLQAQLAFFLTGVVLAWFLLPRSAVGGAALLLTGAVLVALNALPVLVHRHGGVGWLVGLVQRIPLARRWAPRLEAKREAADEIDRQITQLAREHPRRYAAALLLEYAGRCLTVLEFVFIARALGVPVGYGTAYLMASFVSLVVNVFFFVPFAIGTREGGLFAIFALLGLPPELGVATSVIGRVRELAWIALGLACGAATRKQQASDPRPEALGPKP